MVRTAGIRPLVVATVLCASLFALGVTPAFATHFRFGTVTWIRDVTHLPSSEYKFHVVLQTGWRWSFPYGGAASNLCLPGFVPSDPNFGAGSCPPVGSVVTPGSVMLAFDKPVKIGTSQTFVNSTAVAVTVDSVVQSQDLMYTTFEFDMTFQAAFNPVTLTFNGAARLSTLLDGNNDQSFQLVTVVNGDPSFGTRSPILTMLPLINVSTQIDNIIFIPSVAFDGMTNVFRLATSTESLLPNPAPIAPSVFTLDRFAGLVHFTPRANGLYATQFVVTSYDANGIVRNSTPFDLIFSAAAGSPSTVTVTAPAATYTVSPGHLTTVPITQTLTPPNGAYNAILNYTPLPPGMTVIAPNPPSGLAPVVFNVNYTPPAGAQSSLVCFQGSYSNLGTTIFQAGQLCIVFIVDSTPPIVTVPADITTEATSAAGAVATFTATATDDISGALTPTCVPASGSTFPPGTTTVTCSATDDAGNTGSSTFHVIVTDTATSLTKVSAPAVWSITGVPMSTRLTRASDGTPMANQPIVFTLTTAGGLTRTATATTDVNGTAAATLDARGYGPNTASAQFAGVSGLLPSTAQDTALTMYRRSSLSMVAPQGPLVAGGQVTVGAQVTFIGSLDGGLYAPPGESVGFSFNGPNAPAPQTVLVAGTLGVANVTAVFPAAGTYTVQSSFFHSSPPEYYANHNGHLVAETGSLTLDVTTATTSLTAPIATAAVVGNPVTFTTTLTRVSAPSGVVPNAPVSFRITAPGGAVTTLQSTTSVAGVASVSFTPSVRGAHTVLVQFAGDGALAATSNTAGIPVNQFTTLVLSAPATLVANSPLTVNATLTGASDGLPLAGQIVVVTLVKVSPAGPVFMLPAITDGNGLVSVTFPATALATAGTYTVQAAFSAAGNLLASQSSLATLTVIVAVPTALAALNAPASSLIGDALPVSTRLTRVTDGSPIGNAPLSFTLTAPGGAVTVSNSTTDANGVASVSFTPTVNGVHTVSAHYAGSTTTLASTSNTASLTVYLRTLLIVSPVTATAGATTAVSATLLAVPASTPVSGQAVTFSFGGVIPDQSATTDGNGLANVSVNFPIAGTFTATASFSNVAGFFVDANGNPIPDTATSAVTVSSAVTTLSALQAPAVDFVGDTLAVTTTLTRVSAPAGTVANAPIVFSLTGPAANPTTVTQVSTTDANGNAVVTFPLTTRGQFTITASFAGSGALLATTTSQAIAVYQKAFLLASSAHGFAGDPTTLTVGLNALPGLTPVAGERVTFSFGGVVPDQSATTGANGLAVVSAVFPNAGAFPVTASFVDLAAFFADQSGSLIPSTTTATATIGQAATALDPLQAANVQFVGDSLVVTTVLTRGSSPAGTVSGAPVVFSLTGPASNPTTMTVVATTDANGHVVATFLLTARGPFTITASFAGTGALQQASTSEAITAYQRTSLSLAPASGPAGSVISTSATLFTVPGGIGVAREVVTFSFSGPGAPGSQSTVTGANGVATVTAAFPTAGTITATASFSDAAAFFADANGNLVPDTATAPVTVTDSTPPVITPTVTGTLNASGWYTSDVNVSWTVTDDQSAVTSQTGCSPTTLSTDGASFSVNCTATSTGGTSSQTVTFKRDATAPVITTPGNQSANATSVAGAIVNYATATAADPTSGVASLSCAPVSGSQFAIGTTTVTCTATDQAGNVAHASFAVTVVDQTPPALHLPADIAVHATGAAGAVVTFVATATDIVDVTDSVACVPASGSTFAIGTTTVTCTATDGHGNHSSGVFHVTVINTSPVANNDAYSGQWNTALTVAARGVLTNDTDVENDVLSTTLAAGAAHGTVALNATGGFTYMPTPDFSGTDTFTYTASDGRGGVSNVATVRLTITSPCQVRNSRWHRGDDDDDLDCARGTPIADDDKYFTKQATTLTVPAKGVLADDGKYAVTASLLTPPAHGTLTLNANGGFVYVPAPDFFGIDAFVYAARSASGVAGPSATVTIVVRRNLAPDADNDYYSAKKNTTLTVSADDGVLDNDSDPNGDAITAVRVSGPAHGTLTFSANGGFVYKPANNYTGTDTFVYAAKDPLGLTDNATVLIRVGVSKGDHDDDHASHHHDNDGCDHEQHRNGHFDGDGCEHDRRSW